MESVVFDGVVLTDRWTVLSTRGVASQNVQTVEVPGRDGCTARGMTYGCPPVVLVFIVDPTDRAGVLEARRELTALLSVREPKRLEFGCDDGLYYMAMPSGDVNWTQFVHTGKLEVPFLVPSPAMYGAVREAVVPSGGSVTVEVGGTYPTAPKLAADAAVRGSGNVWGVRLDDGDFVHVATGNSSARRVYVDCEARTANVNGSATVPTLDSDWLELVPGEHVLRNDQGTGACTVTWQERWL